MDFKIGRPGSNPLIRDYLAGDERCRPFLSADWRDAEAYRARAESLRGEDRDYGWAETVSTVHPAAQARLEAVIAEGGFVVTTGQQPGLFGGPLYCVWKGLSAIALANELQDELGVPVLPLFWVASEDHDWAETNHTRTIGLDNELHLLQLAEVDGAGDRPLFRLPIDGVIGDAIEQLRGLLPESDIAEEALDAVEAAWSADGDSGTVTLASGFQSFMEGLLGPLGMAFVQAHDPELKRLSLPMLRESWRRAEAIESGMRECAEALEAAEYPVQVPILEGGVNLFLESEGERERIYRDADGFHLAHSDRRFTAEALDEVADTAPDRLSPNVHLRPVVEAAVFPTLAYVAGPGELTYYAQMSPIYAALDTGMPVIYPRHGVTLYESKISKVLEKHSVEESTLQRPFHEIAQDFARDEVPDEVSAALGKLRGAIGEGTGELQKAAMAIDPTLKGPIGSARGQAFGILADAEKAILKAVKRESEVTLQQLEKARLHLYPDGNPQERTLNVVYYLARYGVQFLQDVLERMDPALQRDGDEG